MFLGNDPKAVLHNERMIAASAKQIFAAFAQPEKLAKWWGPKDFTNTFELFEFKPGGRWVFVMHAPNGADFSNESVFREIEPDSRLVIEHIPTPHFCLTVTLTPHGEQTLLNWDQEFESPDVAEKFRPLAATANEQNLDRLEAVLALDAG